MVKMSEWKCLLMRLANGKVENEERSKALIPGFHLLGENLVSVSQCVFVGDICTLSNVCTVNCMSILELW